jgi:hypothetical protein
MSAYIQKISDGKILLSMSSQTVKNVKDLETLQEFVRSRGLLLSDYKIADATEAEIQVMVASAKTPMEVWIQSIVQTDATVPRWFEDYLIENSISLAPGRTKTNYDAKVLLRGKRP